MDVDALYALHLSHFSQPQKPRLTRTQWRCPHAGPRLQGICPTDPVPAPTEADIQLCTSSIHEEELGLEGVAFDACVGAAANTDCKDTVLADPAGRRLIPDWCLDFMKHTAPAFECPDGSATKEENVYCALSRRTAKCGNILCEGGPMVRPQYCLLHRLRLWHVYCALAVRNGCYSSPARVTANKCNFRDLGGLPKCTLV